MPAAASFRFRSCPGPRREVSPPQSLVRNGRKLRLRSRRRVLSGQSADSDTPSQGGGNALRQDDATGYGRPNVFTVRKLPASVADIGGGHRRGYGEFRGIVGIRRRTVGCRPRFLSEKIHSGSAAAKVRLMKPKRPADAAKNERGNGFYTVVPLRSCPAERPFRAVAPLSSSSRRSSGSPDR